MNAFSLLSLSPMDPVIEVVLGRFNALKPGLSDSQ
jgi:hypothetical protein